MRLFRMLMAVTIGLTLLLSSALTATAQEETEGPDPYLAGSLMGTLAGDTENPLGCDPIVAPDGTAFPAVTMSGSFVGATTLLGATTMAGQNCFVPGDPMANVPTGVYTLTGEAGDEISGTWSGDCVPSFVFQPGDTYQCYGLMAVTGGTGAFEGASGQILMMSQHWDAGLDDTGIGNPFPSEIRLEGLIEYGAQTAE